MTENIYSIRQACTTKSLILTEDTQYLFRGLVVLIQPLVFIPSQNRPNQAQSNYVARCILHVNSVSSIKGLWQANSSIPQQTYQYLSKPEDHHQRQQPFFFSSFVHKCNVMDPIDVHVLTSHSRQWLDQSKEEEDWVCGPSLYTCLISYFNKYPFLPLLWNLKQTTVLLQLLPVL